MFSIILTAGICIGMLRRMCLLHVQARDLDAALSIGSHHSLPRNPCPLNQLEYLANALDAPIYQTKQVVSKGI